MSKVQDIKLYQCLPIPDGNEQDIFDYQAIRLTFMYNVIIRSFNSLLYYSGELNPGTPEYTSFLQYAQEVCLFVRQQHQNEETLYLPFFESRIGEDRLSGSIAGHEASHKSLEVFEGHIQHMQSKPNEWDLDLFRASIRRFMPIIMEHFKDELKAVDAAKLREHFTEKELRDFDKTFVKEAAKSINPARSPQLVFVNGDAANGTWFSPFPSAVTFLIKKVCHHHHADMWAFGCCDKEMRLKRPFARYEPAIKV